MSDRESGTAAAATAPRDRAARPVAVRAHTGPARLRVVHGTAFSYDAPVPGSFNETRITPVDERRQAVLTSRVSIDPVTWQHSYTDYWGPRVTAFEVLRPHRELTVTSTSLVDVREPEPMPEVDWETLRRDDVRDARCEHLRISGRTEPGREVLDLAREAAGDLPPAQAAHAVCRLVSDSVTYTKGVTGVHTRAREAWVARRGREDGDVAPLKGIIAVRAASELSVRVEVTREA